MAAVRAVAVTRAVTTQAREIKRLGALAPSLPLSLPVMSTKRSFIPSLSCRPSVSAWSARLCRLACPRLLMKCAQRRKRLKPQRSLDYARDDREGEALGMTMEEGMLGMTMEEGWSLEMTMRVLTT